LRVLFWGTPSFALPSLRALLGEGHEVAAVVTQPDRPSGRGRKVRHSPVKELAIEERISVLTPEKPSGTAFFDTVEALHPEISVVVAYGHILLPEILELPERGSVNVHASLLPELRGAAPVPWAVVRGYEKTGVTVMQMTEGMDEGPILLQREAVIQPEDTASGLAQLLSEIGAEALVETLSLLELGALEPVEQRHDRATYAPKVDREVARIDWTRSAIDVANHIRGMDAVPGAWTMLQDEPLKLFRPNVDESDSPEPAGTVLEADPNVGLIVKAGEGSVHLWEAQPAGRRRMEVGAWLRGGGPEVGERLQ
jgi:methionyl-tRNA formyltransferase